MRKIARQTLLSALPLLFTAMAATTAIAYGEPDPTYKPETLVGASCRQDVQALAANGAVYTSLFRSVFGAGVQNGIVRHRADGSIDRNWGTKGEVAAGDRVAQLQTVGNGGLYAIGVNISRYQPDGTADASFGTAGISDVILPSWSHNLRGTAQQADGSIVTLTSSDKAWEFIRTNAHGLRDTSFGLGGIFTIPFSTVPASASIYAWSVKLDGSLELAWYQKVLSATLPPQNFVKRFRNDLSGADPTFDPGARRVPRQGVADWLSPLAKVQANGALLLATYDCLDDSCVEPMIAVRRFDAFGNVDTAYGAAGKTSFRLLPGERDPRSQASATQMWLGSDGKLTIFMSGVRQFGTFGVSATGTLAYRLNVDGSLDKAFENGKAILNKDRATFLQLDDGSLLRPSYPGNEGCAPQKYLTDTPRTAGVVVEYYSPLLDRYFITAHEFEKVFVDTGTAGDWRQTGQSFGAFSIAASMPGTSPVCRFYSGSSGGPVSHFYSAERFECDILARMEAQTPADKPAWRFERDAFRITVPVAGICPANLTPVYRLYNNGAALGKGSNHRYATDLVVLAEMQNKGWISEGVRMCMPPATRSDRQHELH